jgi:hypothetical protein
MTKPYLRRNEAAAYVTEHYFPLSSKTLAKKACVGGGPTFQKVGNRPIYRPEGLDDWAASELSKPVRSTSELRGGA